MRQNYEVFLADKPLLICDNEVENSAYHELERWHSEGDLSGAIERIQDDDCPGLVIFTKDPDQCWRVFKKHFVRLNAAGGAVMDERGRLLGIHRSGKWDLPKGKLEPGESVEEGARREVMEECGIRQVALGEPLYVTWHCYEHQGKPILKRTDWFRMTASSGEALKPQHEEQIDEVRWLNDEGIDHLRADTYCSIKKVVDAWRISCPRP
jgi:8-oxo-dGTP pyrophosphatase MutT (NUDIX family)